MEPDTLSVSEATTLSEIARLMQTRKLRRLVVVNQNARVIGLVSRNDVLRALLKEAAFDQCAGA
jgi:predicted transcriptional regulator